MNRITRSPYPFEHYEVDLLNASDDDLQEIGRSFVLGLSLEELRYIRDIYIIKERRATDVELQTYDQTFSEHCSHKTLKGIVKTPKGEIRGLLNTYIRKVVEEL